MTNSTKKLVEKELIKNSEKSVKYIKKNLDSILKEMQPGADRFLVYGTFLISSIHALTGILIRDIEQIAYSQKDTTLVLDELKAVLEDGFNFLRKSRESH